VRSRHYEGEGAESWRIGVINNNRERNKERERERERERETSQLQRTHFLKASVSIRSFGP